MTVFYDQGIIEKIFFITMDSQWSTNGWLLWAYKDYKGSSIHLLDVSAPNYWMFQHSAIRCFCIKILDISSPNYWMFQQSIIGCFCIQILDKCAMYTSNSWIAPSYWILALTVIWLLLVLLPDGHNTEILSKILGHLSTQWSGTNL